MLGYDDFYGFLDMSWATRQKLDQPLGDQVGPVHLEQLVIDGQNGTLKLYTDGKITILSRDGQMERTIEPKTCLDHEESHYRLQSHFVACLEAGEEFQTSGHDNLQTLRLAFGVYESAVQHRTAQSNFEQGAIPLIIDVHAHLGWDYVFDEHFTREDQLNKHKIFQVDRTILQPASCHDLESVVDQHNTIAALTQEFPGVFYGMANPNPHLKAALYEQEIRRCIEELGFVGIKIHTFAHAVHPSGHDGRKVFDLARKLQVPVMVHTGSGIPFANPSNLIPAAEQYPDVKIIIAHCGMMIMAGETGMAMKRCPNLYADITWTGGFLLRHWAEELGAHRFMFGTDHADNAGTELAKLRTCGLSDADQEWMLYKTALDVYFRNIVE